VFSLGRAVSVGGYSVSTVVRISEWSGVTGMTGTASWTGTGAADGPASPASSPALPASGPTSPAGDGPASPAGGVGWAGLATSDPCAGTVAALETADPTGLTGAQLIDAIVACEKSISHLHAIQAELTTAFARPGVAGDVTTLVTKLCAKRGAARGPDGQIDPDVLQAHIAEFARSLAAAEIAAALHIPHRTAAVRIDHADELVAELPTACRALRTGRIDQRRARVIADGTRCLNPAARAAAEAAVTPLAADRLPAQLAELLDRAVIAADPQAAHQRQEQARADRNVRHLPGRDGMAKLHATLTAEGAAAAFTMLDLLAQATADHDAPTGQKRGIDARRADAMTDIFTELLATGRIDLTGYGKPQPHTDAQPDTGTNTDGGTGSTDAGINSTDTGSTDAGINSTETDTGPHHADAAGGNSADTGSTDIQPDTHADIDPDPRSANSPGDNNAGSTGIDHPADADPRSPDTPGHNSAGNMGIDHPATSADIPIDPRSPGAIDADTPTAAHLAEPATQDEPAGPRDGTAGESGVWRGLSRHGRRPHLIVTVGMSTLAGLDRLPGQLAGHGAITAELALTLAEAYQTLTLVGINPDTGTAAAVSHTIYRPRQHLTDQIAALVGTCTFPSCRQPGWRCDTDHRVPFDHTDPDAGGKTTLWDCDPQCRRHHLFKTHAHWLAEGRPDRCIQFTSPTGHTYLTRPHEYTLPGETTQPELITLMRPASTPTFAPPASTDTPDHPGGDPPVTSKLAAQVRKYLHAQHEQERQLARNRAVHHRMSHLMNGDALDAWPTPNAKPGSGRNEPTRPGGTSRPGTIGASGRGTIAPDSRALCAPGEGNPGPPSANNPDHTRRRRLTRRDRTAANAVERAIRIANGEPDPADEPPPF
jgi:hypothetical protein